MKTMASFRAARRSRASFTVRYASTNHKRVLVVGGGPVGMAMGFLLEHLYQIPTRIIERQSQPTQHPRAHFLNLRTMEILKTTMPSFHDQLLNEAAHCNQWRHYVYGTGVSKAQTFAHVDQLGPCLPPPSSPSFALREALASVSSTQFVHFPQNRFEQLMATQLEHHGLRIDRCVELEDLVLHTNQKPIVKLRHTETNQVEETSYDFVIAADGAHSLVRKRCNIPMVGAKNLQSLINVHFMSQSLSKIAQANPAMLYFIFNQQLIGVLIAHDFQQGEWVLQIPFFPPQESIASDFQPHQCRHLIQQILPNHSDDIQILSVGQWQMSARVAAQFDQQQRVFLVGDAAHQMPPAGGLGMNTGIQDAYNLAWKLAMVMQQADVDQTALLQSYERDRQPIAKLNTQLSLRNFERTMKVPTALNVSHHNAQLLSTIVNGTPFRHLPLRLQREFLQNVMHMGRMPLGLLDQTHLVAQQIKRRVQYIVENYESLGMLYYHFDIGYTYATTSWNALARQLMSDAELNASALFQPCTEQQATVFDPNAVVLGRRFPHLRLQDGIASLDLPVHVTQHGNVAFVLLVTESTQLKPTEFHQHVAVVSIGNFKVDGSKHFESIHQLEVDPQDHERWQAMQRSFGAALIRPDGHIGHLWPSNASITSSSIQDAVASAIQLSS